ncbi:MAG: aminotransferase class V-fold PLP-dependent enzyme [Oscillospiraceae bacterium]|nr:aminotransferase class V-fold PLP-dependent enzyme [Oscillospiraceae bacterium]
MENKVIYLDNAATTRVSDEVFAEMEPYLKNKYGNASTIYSLGRESAVALKNARERIAACFGCDSKEIFFTGGGSESNNWAIKSAAELMSEKGQKHIISSVFEHHAVLHVLQTLERKGFDVTYLPVGERGLIDMSDLKAAIRPDTGLVTVMYVNNEIGTIQPIDEIGALCQTHGILFHTDAVQAVGNIPINVDNISLLSCSAHKIHAMKGLGLLYVDKKIKLPAFIEGGAQELGMRAGTENIAGIVGFALAVESAFRDIEKKREKLLSFKNKIIDSVLKQSHVRVNGDVEKSVASIVNFSFEGIEGESLLLMLDLKGIAASSASACTSGSLEPSHVLLALGMSHETAHGSLRISMSDYTTQSEIDYFLAQLPPMVQKLRNMSPTWEKLERK